MSFDFPNSPSLNQEFAPLPGITYVWNGQGWVLNPASIKGFTIVPRVFTASASYVPTPGLVFAQAECVGGGGAGGGTTGNASSVVCGGGGGSGGYSRRLLTAAQIGSSQTITVGAGGTGVSSANGNAGTDTSFGSLCIAKGGSGGGGGSSRNSAGAGASISGAVGDIVAAGAPGTGGGSITTATGAWGAGVGGSSVLGGGGVAFSISGASTPGAAGSNYGSGGGGGNVDGLATTSIGGNGSPGVCIVTEYIGNQPLVGGNVSSAGVPSAGQKAIWTGATTIQGVSDAGARVLIQTQTVSSAVAQVDFITGIDSTYDEYELSFSNVIPVTNADTFALRLRVNAAFQSGAGAYRRNFQYANDTGATATEGSNSDTSIYLGNVSLSSNVASRVQAGVVKLYRPSQSGVFKIVRFENTYNVTTGAFVSGFGGGMYQIDTNPVDGLRFYFGVGNIAAGTFNLYGIKK